MNNSETIHHSSLMSAAGWLGLSVFAVGCLVVAGWILDIGILKTMVPGYVSMKLNTALCFTLLGLTLLLHNLKKSHPLFYCVSLASAGMVTLIGAATLAEYLFHVDLFLDQVIIPEPPNTVGTRFPGRMAFLTALNFFLLGISLLLTAKPATAQRVLPAQILAVVAFLVGYLVVMGYIYNLVGSLGPASSTWMALHTAILFILAAAGFLISHPNEGLTKAYSGSSGVVQRRLLPAILAIPPLVELPVHLGLQAGLFDEMLAQAFHTLLVVLFLVLISLWLIDSVKRAEKNLERERHLSDSILESLPGIFYLFDSDGRFLRWNKNFEKITGYTADEFSRLHPEDLFRGEEKLYIRARINRVFTEGKSDAEAHLVSKPGRKIPFYFTGLRIDYEGRPHLIGVGNDITGLKSAENELRESEERYRDLYEHAPDMFLSVNASNAEILTCNNTFLVKTGYSREEILGKKVFEIYHPDCLEHAGKAFHQFCSTGEVLDEELILKRQDGTTLDVSLNVKAVRDHTGCIIHSRSSLRDISDRKRMERKLSELNEELARSNADLEQFAYVASHDLQEPLRMVAGFTQLLARRYQGKLDSKADEYIHYAVDGAHRMQNLINDLLEYSRISSRGNPFGEVESSVLLTNAITHLGIRIRETEARITHDALPVIACDGSQVTRVFQNLLDNALKYHGGNQPRIHISATTAASGWQFEVRDNGVGIQPEYRDRIFEIFERLEPKKYPGTGIGLAVCKKIIHRHGGRIWVESIEGSGSTFCFTISRNKTKNERTREV